MPTTFRQGISRVRSMNKLISADGSITDRAIAAEIISTSTLLIKRETNLRRLWNSPNLFTYIKCLKMTSVPLAECCDYTSPCNIMRSVCKLPKIEEGLYNLIVLPVTSIDGKIRFEEGTPNRYANALKLDLPRKPKMFWIENDYLYISHDSVEAVNFAYYTPYDDDNVLNNPDCICSKKTNMDNCPINPLDKTWKIPAYLEENVLSMVHEKIAKTYFSHTTEPNSNITKDEQR